MTTISYLPKQGLQTPHVQPPERLAQGSLFSTQEKYVSFLNAALADPAGFWMKMADDLVWFDKPTSPGDPGAWFEGGKINIAANCLDEQMKRTGGGEAVLWKLDESSGKPVSLSRKELSQEVAAVEKQLASWWLSPGDSVLLALPPDESLIISTLACLRRGLTCVTINPSVKPERIVRRVSDASCKGAVMNAESSAQMKASGQKPDEMAIQHWLTLSAVMDREFNWKEAPWPVDSMHPAFMISDTAGQIFTLPTAGFLVQAVSAYRHLLDGRGSGDILWLLTPGHHAALHSAAIGALASGGQIGMMPPQAAHDLDKFAQSLEKTKPRVLLSDVNTIGRLVNKAMTEKPDLKIAGPSLLIMEGEMLEPMVWDYVVNNLFDGRTHLVQTLSRPEAGGFIAGPHPAATPVMRSSVALPAPGMELTIVTKGRECEPGHGGLLALKKASPGLCIELQATKPPIAIEVKARRDKSGYFWTMGEVEIKMTVERGISIPEIEALIASVEGVDHVAVIRYPNAKGEYETKAFIKLMGNLEISDEEMRGKICERYGNQLGLTSCQVVTRLPYSRSGKLLRSVLKRICTREPMGSDDLRLVMDADVIEELSSGRDKGDA